MFDDWIGRSWSQHDTVTAGLVARFAATVAGADTEGVPPGLHWCLGLPAFGPAEMGEDGHAVKGVDLPPIPLPRRMWAGGEITFHAPLAVGDTVLCERHIVNVAEKLGRTGTLYFVTLGHRYSVGDQLRIEETRDIVYRDAARPGAPVPSATPSAPVATAAAIKADPVTLFRYSALTFNGHRIHYDQPYATGAEHYPGLVVQGPLQASWLMQLARSHAPLRRFSYRATSPLILGDTAHLAIEPAAGGAELSICNAEGVVTMLASAQW